MGGRGCQLHAGDRQGKLQSSGDKIPAPIYERMEHAGLLHLGTVQRHGQWLFQRREWARRELDDSELLGSEHGLGRVIVWHHSLSIVGDSLRAAVWQGKEMVEKRTRFLDPW